MSTTNETDEVESVCSNKEEFTSFLFFCLILIGLVVGFTLFHFIVKLWKKRKLLKSTLERCKMDAGVGVSQSQGQELNCYILTYTYFIVSAAIDALRANRPKHDKKPDSSISIANLCPSVHQAKLLLAEEKSRDKQMAIMRDIAWYFSIYGDYSGGSKPAAALGLNNPHAGISAAQKDKFAELEQKIQAMNPKLSYDASLKADGGKKLHGTVFDECIVVKRKTPSKEKIVLNKKSDGSRRKSGSPRHSDDERSVYNAKSPKVSKHFKS